MMKQTKVKKKEEEIPGRSLIDLVLSWSINDVLNEDYYKYQVRAPLNSHPPGYKQICNTHTGYEIDYTVRMG